MSKIKEMKKRILEDVEQEIDTVIKSSGKSPGITHPGLVSCGGSSLDYGPCALWRGES
jgi:hypothetical protein